MTTRVLVKPVEGRLVRIPGTYAAIDPAGTPVEMDSYWVRKVAAGDVEFATQEPAVQAPIKGEKQ